MTLERLVHMEHVREGVSHPRVGRANLQSRCCGTYPRRRLLPKNSARIGGPSS